MKYLKKERNNYMTHGRWWLVTLDWGAGRLFEEGPSDAEEAAEGSCI